MLEFITTNELKPHPEIIEIIKDFTYTINKGKIKHLLKTNLQFIEPTEYLITYPITLTILEYKVMKSVISLFISKNIMRNIISKKLNKFY